MGSGSSKPSVQNVSNAAQSAQQANNRAKSAVVNAEKAKNAAIVRANQALVDAEQAVTLADAQVKQIGQSCMEQIQVAKKNRKDAYADYKKIQAETVRIKREIKAGRMMVNGKRNNGNINNGNRGRNNLAQS